MGRKISTRLPNFCLNRIRPHVRVRSPPVQFKPIVSSNQSDQVSGKSRDLEEDKVANVIGRKIMIVVDSSPEAKGALQWALSQTVQNQDSIILLHVTKPRKQGTGEESGKNKNSKGYDLVSSFKNMCKQKRPEVEVEVVVVEGEEKGATIVEEARKREAGLLVLGQKKKSMTWRMVMMWAGNKVSGGVVEYCIQNATCMALAVRRKSKKLGGWLITTKRHKDFWLLA